MTEPMKLAVVLTPTPHEYSACRKRLSALSLNHWRTHCIMTGPGKANAAFHMGSLQHTGQLPDLVIGAGTSGALRHGLRQGEIIASAEAVVADWKMIDDQGEAYARYGELQYMPELIDSPGDMRITCKDTNVIDLLETLEQRGFRRGVMLTSDIFIAGERNKLAYGERFDCLACDMESGIFGFLANRYLRRPWLNIRVVADTIGESFADYVSIEPEMTRILAEHLESALEHIDSQWV